MLLTIALGLALGSLAGLVIGHYLFSLALKPKKYRKLLNVSADDDPKVVAPEHGTPTAPEFRKLLEYTESWTHWPDHERVSMINRMLTIMWPHVAAPGLDMGMKIGKGILGPILNKLAFVEDVILGQFSMKAEERPQDVSEWLSDKVMSLGAQPPTLGGIKSYDTAEDEVVLETTLLWGSDAQLDVGIILQFGLFRIFIPVAIANPHMKVDMRLTIKPLVETFPCVGGATISLLKVPHVDMSLKLSKGGLDLMALPFMKKAVRKAMELALGNLVLYPCSMSFPIMKDYGLPPAPSGALNVKLLRAEGLQFYPTRLRLNTRINRFQFSKTLNTYNPTIGQEFDFIVEDLQKQYLNICLYENRDDGDWNEPKIGVGRLPFGKDEVAGSDPETGKLEYKFSLAQFVKVAMNEELVAVKLTRPSVDQAPVVKKKKGPMSSFSFHNRGRDRGTDCGTVYLKVKFMPLFQPEFDDEDSSKAKPILPTMRTVTHNVPDKLKGVLTVTLMRCLNLKGDEPSTYVRLILSHGNVENIQESATVHGENNPRWGQKFDFVMIPAGSTLYFIVYQKCLEGVPMLKKRKDVSLGSLALPVKDVARNGNLKDIWTLQDTERGAIELQLKWQTSFLYDEE